jgi:hypothetical protein
MVSSLKTRVLTIEERRTIMGKSNIDRYCPKCGGKILIEKDYHGWYEECLQCSYMRDLKVLYEQKTAGATANKGRGETARISGG